VVQATISALEKSAKPEAATVLALQERASDDPNGETRKLAKGALENILARHLESTPLENIAQWLNTLQAFGRSDCGTQLEHLMYSLDDDPDLRSGVASAIGECMAPEEGIPLIEKRLNDEPVERNAEVRSSLESALDNLRGSPDNTLLRLLDDALDASLTKAELLGEYSFEALFSIPNTMALLRSHLVKLKKESANPDAFITRLDGIADIIGNELEDALHRKFPDSKSAGGRRGYQSQIEFMGRINPELKGAASALHELRRKSDLPHVVDETSGEPKPGCDHQDLSDSKRHFQVIIRQAMLYLQKDYRIHRE
jgi:hypothetical protein